MLIHHGTERSWGDVNHVFGTDKRLYVQCISFTYTEPGCDETKLLRDRYFIHFVNSGKVMYDKRAVHKGEIYLMEPGSLHRLKNISDEPLTQFCIEFHGADAEELCAESGVSNTSLHHALNESRLRRVLHEAVYDTADISESALAKMALGTLYYLLSQLVCPDDCKVSRRIPDYVTMAADFMRENYMYGIGAGDAAEAIGLTEKYLCRLFKRELNVSPSEYLLEYRCERAMELLSSSELSVAEIARMVGFNDPAYFSRFIRKKTGKSPLAHRA